MARKKYEFRPDKVKTDFLGKLYLTPQQRKKLLRWLLFAVLLVTVSVLQDVVLCRISYLGGGTDLVPCLIFMIAALEGAEEGSIFALIASVVYFFSGSAPGPYMIPLVTGIAIFMAILRQACLPRGFFSILLCAALGMAAYEMLLFAIGMFLGNIPLDRMEAMLRTALYTLCGFPIAYPLARLIGKIGGETWKE